MEEELTYKVTPETLCYIHISIDNYKPDLMQRDAYSGEYYLQRMVPPRKIEYFFSLVETPTVDKFSHMIPSHVVSQSAVIIPESKVLENIIKQKRVINETFIQELHSMPRPGPKLVQGIVPEK